MYSHDSRCVTRSKRCCVTRRWWAFKVLSRIPGKDHDEVMLKAAAYDCLGGKRKNWALQTRWHGNYLAKVLVYDGTAFFIA